MPAETLSPYPALTVLTFWPVVAAIALAFVKGDENVRRFTLGASIVELVLAWPLLGFQHISGFQFMELHSWVESWKLQYYMGVDGVSIMMIWLSLFTLPVCVLCSWTYIGRRVKEFHVCLLLMTTACIGVFSALDLVLFYVFWEALLIPMYLMIAIWGGDDRRYASIKFFIYTLAGSTLLLVAIAALRIVGGTFSIPELMNTVFPFRFQFWIFLGMGIAFAIKVPMFPFHTWLPAAHVQAPSAGSVILAAVLLKMGAYGFLRFSLPLCPAASEYFAPLMIALSLAAIIYGGAIALGQTDIKKLVAYSSVAHMGFVTLGIFLFTERGIEGAIVQMLNHGIITGGLFMLIGTIYERSHSREISKNMGLGKYLPAFMFFWGLMGLASFGFPGTNGFVGEFLVIVAALAETTKIGGVNVPLIGLLTIPGAMLAAAYSLKVLLKLAWGKPDSAKGKGWKDLNIREWVYMLVPAVFVFYLGLAPTGLLKTIDPSINNLVKEFDARKLEKPDRPLKIAGPDLSVQFNPGEMESKEKASPGFQIGENLGEWITETPSDCPVFSGGLSGGQVWGDSQGNFTNFPEIYQCPGFYEKAWGLLKLLPGPAVSDITETATAHCPGWGGEAAVKPLPGVGNHRSYDGALPRFGHCIENRADLLYATRELKI